MAIYKEKNGTYKVVYYHTNFEGERVMSTKRGFAKKSEAEFFDCKMKRRNKSKQKDISGMMLEDFVNKYYFPAMEGQLKVKSLITKRHLIDTHILNVNNKPIASFKNKRLRDITVDEIINWQKEKQREKQDKGHKKGYSDGYLLSMRKELSAILNYAEKQYGWLKNPSVSVPRMGKFNKRVRKDDWWTIDEFDAFIDTVDKNSRYYIIWNVLFYSGIRLGELLALKRKDIDSKMGAIIVDETYARLEKQDMFSTPKTENSDRIVYLPNDVMDLLTNYLSMHPDIQDNDRIFPICHRAVEQAFARHIKKSNSRYITVHCLRHSHCAYLISLGVSMSVISVRMGHKDEIVTSQVYAHVYNKDAMDVAQVLQVNMNSRKEVSNS